MEKYKASDIVKRAMALADMENSSFITYKEQVDYLSLAWKQVCQALINKGCKYYIKSVEVPGKGEYDLPEDFYQAESLRTKNGNIIERHTASMSDEYLSYDIIGNRLVIYGTSVDLELNYWRVPDTLTFPANKKDIELPFDLKDYALCGNKIVSLDNGTLMILDISTGDIVNISTSATTFYAAKGLVWTVAGRAIVVFNYQGNQVASFTGEYSFIRDENDNIRPYKFSNNTLDIYNVDGSHVIETIPVVARPIGFALRYNENVWAITSNGLVNITTGTIIDDSTVTMDIEKARTTLFDNKPSIVWENNISWEDGDRVVSTTTDVNAMFNYGLLKADANTGYGYLTSDGTNYSVESWVPDTLLDFPNTLLFEYLAYVLAYYFIIKQSASTESIEKALNNAELAFFDSLDNGGTYGKIINVYGR